MQELIPKRKLLLADDSVTIQKVVNLTFADEGIEVVSVGDGNSAMDKLREDSPDIVLADVNMPGLTGYEICARIKGGEIGEKIPVVLLVGSFEPFDEEEAERVGADGYLTKPFQSIGQLVDKVSELLGLADADISQTATIEHFEEHHVFTETVTHVSEFEQVPGNNETVEMSSEGVDDIARTEPAIFAEEDTYTEFQDEDEFEMSEAFGDERDSSEHQEFKPEDQEVEEVSADFLRTQPLTESDLKEILVDSEPETADFASTELEVDSGEETFDEGGFFPLDDDLQPSYDEFQLDQSVPEPPGREEEFNQPQVGETYSPQFVNDSVGIEQSGAQPDFPIPEGATVLNLDEINLLELPPVDTNNVEEAETHFESAPETQVEDTLADLYEEKDIAEPEIYNSVSEDDEFDEGADIVVETPSDTPVDRVGIKQDVEHALSKETVEAITQRVIETLSEKAIRDIAWEVVPDLADLIIKKMAEEKMKE